MPRSPTVRPAQLSDVPEIQRIGREADARFSSVGHPELCDGSTIPSEVAAVAIARGQLHVAIVEARVVGWAYLGRVAGELCLGQISVDPASGREGVGGALLTDVISRARALGEASIVLNTQSDVPWNRPWFERHGFVVIERPEWSPALAKLAEQQSAAGVDWTSRVHMRLALQTA